MSLETDICKTKQKTFLAKGRENEFWDLVSVSLNSRGERQGSSLRSLITRLWGRPPTPPGGSSEAVLTPLRSQAAPSLPVRHLHNSYSHTQADVPNQHSSPESGRRNHPNRFGNLDPKPLRWEIHLEDMKTTGILREAAKIPTSLSSPQIT